VSREANVDESRAVCRCAYGWLARTVSAEDGDKLDRRSSLEQRGLQLDRTPQPKVSTELRTAFPLYTRKTKFSTSYVNAIRDKRSTASNWGMVLVLDVMIITGLNILLFR
jgi:hypothetical protein